jgi:hypothetical protein
MQRNAEVPRTLAAADGGHQFVSIQTMDVLGLWLQAADHRSVPGP